MNRNKYMLAALIGIGVFLLINFKLYTLSDELATKVQFTQLDGSPASWQQNKGKHLLVFFGTWCSDCRRELPELASHKTLLLQEAKLNVYIISDESADKVQRYLEKNPFPFNFYITQQKFKSLGIRSVPSALLLDENGKVIKKWNGSIQLTASEWKTLLAP